VNRFWDESDRPREEMLADDVRTLDDERERAPLFRELRAAAESGWDFSSRWSADLLARSSSRTTKIAPVDLNCLLALYEMILARAHEAADHEARSVELKARSERRAHTIRKHFWDQERAWYTDYLYEESVPSPSLSLAGVYALFAGIATSEQADQMEITLREKFLREGGLVTTLVQTGEQWDAPNGWAPLHYLATEGLERYGKHSLAEDIAERWVESVKRMYKRFGALMEKYNVDDPHELAGGGEYGIQDGFGWTNAVTLHFMNTYDIEGEVVFE
jgi:alpha,alpha-trehalase